MIYTLRKLTPYEYLYDRRKYLKSLIDQGVDIDLSVRKDIKSKFKINNSTLNDDIRFLTVEKLAKGPYHVYPKVREFVFERDNYICQYCGSDEDYPVAEHVIPTMMGGVAMPCNLVVACWSCNSRKGRSVWVPINIDIITQDNPYWKQKILEMAVKGKPSE